MALYGQIAAVMACWFHVAVLGPCVAPFGALPYECVAVVVCLWRVRAPESCKFRCNAAVCTKHLTALLQSALFQIPTGHVWLQGDNLIMSRDSREYGPVPLALVRGRVVCQVSKGLQQ